VDDASLHADRIKLWDDFNHAWLALGQRQVDLMQSGQKSHRLLSQDTIEKLGNEIVRLSDGLERHGLVDYQYGVWEDQIVAGALLICLLFHLSWVFCPWLTRSCSPRRLLGPLRSRRKGDSVPLIHSTPCTTNQIRSTRGGIQRATLLYEYATIT
jgi:hypothetical protein